MTTMQTSPKVSSELVRNAAGRMVPTEVNGRPQTPFLGVGAYEPDGQKSAPPIRRCADYPTNGDKRVADLRTALEKCGLRDGMVISNHHHLRNGDRVALEVLKAADSLGVKDLMWFPSAAFPCQAEVIDLMEKRVVHHIEGSMNGPLGDYCSQGKMRGMGVLRSHGGRWQAIQDGEVQIDIAIIAAPTAAASQRRRRAIGSLASSSSRAAIEGQRCSGLAASPRTTTLRSQVGVLAPCVVGSKRAVVMALSSAPGLLPAKGRWP